MTTVSQSFGKADRVTLSTAAVEPVGTFILTANNRTDADVMIEQGFGMENALILEGYRDDPESPAHPWNPTHPGYVVPAHTLRQYKVREVYNQPNRNLRRTTPLWTP